MTQTPFSQQIQHLNKGMLDDELTQLLSDVVKAVRETGKSGTVTLTLKVKPLNNKGIDDDAVQVIPETKNMTPKLPQKAMVMWSTGDGDLLRRDPSQQEIDFTTVEAAAPPKAPVSVPEQEKAAKSVG